MIFFVPKHCAWRKGAAGVREQQNGMAATAVATGRGPSLARIRKERALAGQTKGFVRIAFVCRSHKRGTHAHGEVNIRTAVKMEIFLGTVLQCVVSETKHGDLNLPSKNV